MLALGSGLSAATSIDRGATREPPRLKTPVTPGSLSSRCATMMMLAQPPPGVSMAVTHARHMPALGLCTHRRQGHGLAIGWSISARLIDGNFTRELSRYEMHYNCQSAQLTLSDDDGACTAASGRADGHSTRLERASHRLTRLGRSELRPRRRGRRYSRAISTRDALRWSVRSAHA